MKRKNSQKPNPAAEVNGHTVTSFADLQKLVSQPVHVEFKFNRQKCRITARYLNPFETELLRLILDELGAPPMRKVGNDIEADLLDPGWQQKKTRLERKMRILAVFWTCKDMQDMWLQESQNSDPARVAIANMYAPQSVDPILEFVKKRFVDELLDVIYDSIREAPITIQDKVNLSLPGGKQSSQS